MEITNIDELLPTIEDPVLPVCDNPLAPKHPFRLLVNGPSSCGKSNAVMNLIINHLNFDRIIFYARDMAEDKYQYLISFYHEIECECNKQQQARAKKSQSAPDQKPIKIAEFYENPDMDSIITANDLDKDKRNLIVFDDFITKSKLEHKPIIDLFIRSRKRNTSVIYIAHSYYSVPKDIRLNTTHLILFGVNTEKELLEIQKSLAFRVERDTFVQLFRKIVNEPYRFMFIDTCAKDLSMHIRRGFDGLLDIGECYGSGIMKK